MSWPTYSQLTAASRKLQSKKPELPEPLEGDAAQGRLRMAPGAAPGMVLFSVAQLCITRHHEALAAYLLAGGELRQGEQNRVLLWQLSTPAHARIRAAAELTITEDASSDGTVGSREKGRAARVAQHVAALPVDDEPMVI
jgi:hypothetical protein